MPADTTQNLACRYLSSLVSCVDIIIKKHAQPHKSAHRQHKQKKCKLHRVRGRPWQFSAWASVLKIFFLKKTHGLLLLFSLVSICDWAASCYLSSAQHLSLACRICWDPLIYRRCPRADGQTI